ncbi:U3-containing 90S pre-ribosomal complex subunit-domain containing protein [Ochromonadaceae sp. CCMP2298]|nr:U3-containing 90S pre-ribosomal complex subunit-domain containing protein [Ochromonadaceae sp. CCMP2298]
MGDAIEEDVWDGENEVDLEKDYKSDDEFEDDLSTGEETEEQQKKNQKVDKKRRRLEDAKLRKKAKLSEEPSDDQAKPAALTPAEMLLGVESNRPKSLGNVEIKDFSESDFVYPDLDESATTKSVKNKRVCPFVRALSANMPNYKQLLLNSSVANKEDFGCPQLLILCSSAIRATQIIKSISARLIKCRVAKLFAKHFKIEEQMESLSKEYHPIAVGTPNRISKLIELGALSLRRTLLILIDVTPDAKQFTILTLNEVKVDFFRLLYQHIHPITSRAKIALIRE